MHVLGRTEGRRGRVLVVEANARAREWEAAWLEGAGFEVSMCPGPTAPDYGCVGSRTGACPLASDADVIVLDMTLAADVAGEGTRAWELLLLYFGLGKPTVVITGRDEPFIPSPGERVAVVDRPVGREKLLEAVGSVFA